MKLKTIRALLVILIAGSLSWAGKLRAQQPETSSGTQPSTSANTTGAGQAAPEQTGTSPASNRTVATRPTAIDYSKSRSFPNILEPYASPNITPGSMSNSERLHSLIENGKLELSLQDAIALALENNLDIEVARYSLKYAQLDILRTESGGATRGINPGLFGGVQAFAGTSGGGGGGGTGGAGGLTGGSGAGSVGTTSCCDPFVGANFRWDRNSSPLNFITVSGVPVVTNQTTSGSAFLTQGFLTGTSYAIAMNGFRQSTTSHNTLFNPEVPTGLTFGFTQKLLNGFGYRANAKFIRIARNDLQLADSTFRQQVITTVANVSNLYSDLVSFKENVRVAQQALSYAQRLLADNKRQVEIGTLAPIEVVRAESEVATDEQALIVAETSYQQQQELLKTAISKHVDADLAAAVVEPTDKLPEPNALDVPSLDLAMHQAERNRPELVTANNNILNQEITIQAARNGLLPSVDLFGTYAPTGLSGNRIVNGQVVSGGLFQSFSQGFHGNYPDYAFGVSIQIPVRNRTAQADMTIALLQERQLRTQLQQQRNVVAQDVRNAEIAVTQANAQVAAAVKATRLAQETYDAENKKYQLGESTVFNVILTQRDLATAQGNEVKARSTYAKAVTQLGQATASILDRNHIELAEAKEGRVRRTPNIPGTPEPANR